MAADTLKALSITNLDAVPVIPNPTGNGANGYLKNITDYVTPTAAGLVATTSTYKLVRLPSNAKLKWLALASDLALDSSTGLALDVGAYYSDSANDGTAAANQGVLISANCFAAILTFQATHQNVFALGQLAVALRNAPLWKAVGLTADPGGFIDVVAAVHTAATTAVSSNLGVDCDYVE